MTQCVGCGSAIEQDDEFGDWFVPDEGFPSDMYCGGLALRAHAPMNESVSN